MTLPATALINDTTGSVLGWGFTEFAAGPGQSIAQISDPTSHPGGPSEYVKVVDGLFVAMNAAERAVVDLTVPHARILRIKRPNEIQVTTGNADPGNGWVSALGSPMQAPALSAGDYQLAITFEAALLAPASWGASGPTSGSQVRLLLNGSEIATWLLTMSEYDGRGASFSANIVDGARPTFDVQLRRFGAPATARIRRLALTIAPVAKPHVDQ